MEIKVGMKISRDELEKDGWEVVGSPSLTILVFQKGDEELQWSSISNTVTAIYKFLKKYR